MVSDGAIVPPTPVLALNYCFHFGLFWLNMIKKSCALNENSREGIFPSFLHFPLLQTQPSWLRQDLCSFFLHKFHFQQLVFWLGLRWSLLNPAGSTREPVSTAGRSLWTGLFEWEAMLHLFLYVIKKTRIVLEFTQTMGTQQIWVILLRRMGSPSTLCSLRECFSCMVRSINLRHFLFLCWNVTTAANCASSSPWMVAALHTLRKSGTPVLVAASITVSWLNSFVVTK